MFARILEHDEHTRRYLIRHEDAGGWKVTTEHDGRLRLDASYQDWHRVERARLRMDLEIAALEASGWHERN